MFTSGRAIKIINLLAEVKSLLRTEGIILHLESRKEHDNRSLPQKISTDHRNTHLTDFAEIEGVVNIHTVTIEIPAELGGKLVIRKISEIGIGDFHRKFLTDSKGRLRSPEKVSVMIRALHLIEGTLAVPARKLHAFSPLP